MKKFLPIFLVLVILIPVLVDAQSSPPEKPILPDCGTIVGTKINRECGYNDLLQLVNNIINWIIMIAVPVAAGVLAWAGFKYMTTGISDQKSEAKKMIQKVCIGLVFILAAWLIVSTILNALLAPNFKTAVDKVVDITP